MYEANDFHWISMILNQLTKILLFNSSFTQILFIFLLNYFLIQIRNCWKRDKISSLIFIT